MSGNPVIFVFLIKLKKIVLKLHILVLVSLKKGRFQIYIDIFCPWLHFESKTIL